MFYLKTAIEQPLSYVFCGKFTAEDTWIHERFNHTIYEVLISMNHTIYIQQDDRRYALGPGDAILLLPGHTHQGYAPSDKGTQAYWLHFNLSAPPELMDQVDAQKEMMQLQNNSYYPGLENAIFLSECLRGMNMDRIGVLFNQLLHLSQKAYYTKQSVNYIVTSLLIEMTEQMLQSVQATEPDIGDRQLHEILEWIENHLTHSISLQDVAAVFPYTKNYLAMYFKKKMGTSMQTYIINRKLSVAKEMLYSTDKTVKEIAFALGFQDEKYFMRLFKKLESITPTAFRNTYYLTHWNH